LLITASRSDLTSKIKSISLFVLFSLQQYYNNTVFKGKPFANVTAKVSLVALERLLSGSKDYKGHANKMLRELIKVKQPIHIGGMYDPYPRSRGNRTSR